MTTTNEDVKELLRELDEGLNIDSPQSGFIVHVIRKEFGQRGTVLLEGYLKKIGNQLTLDGRHKDLYEKLQSLRSA